jgi:hypothetical protein
LFTQLLESDGDALSAIALGFPSAGAGNGEGEGWGEEGVGIAARSGALLAARARRGGALRGGADEENDALAPLLLDADADAASPRLPPLGGAALRTPAPAATGAEIAARLAALADA